MISIKAWDINDVYYPQCRCDTSPKTQFVEGQSNCPCRIKEMPQRWTYSTVTGITLDNPEQQESHQCFNEDLKIAYDTCCAGCLYPIELFSKGIPDYVLLNGVKIAKSGNGYGTNVNGVFAENGSWNIYENGNIISAQRCLFEWGTNTIDCALPDTIQVYVEDKREGVNESGTFTANKTGIASYFLEESIGGIFLVGIEYLRHTFLPIADGSGFLEEGSTGIAYGSQWVASNPYLWLGAKSGDQGTPAGTYINGDITIKVLPF